MSNYRYIILIVLWISTASLALASAKDLAEFSLIFKPGGYFEPTYLEVPVGRFKLELINESYEPIEFESIPLRKEKVLAPGTKSFVVIKTSRPGEFSFFDDFHRSARGIISVKDLNQ